MQKYLTKVLQKPDNLILLSDGYKYSHSKFYGGENKMISYVESRGGKFDNTVFLWFTNFLKKHTLRVLQ
jgi:nicotinamide phosphoribosyltransferase